MSKFLLSVIYNVIIHSKILQEKRSVLWLARSPLVHAETQLVHGIFKIFLCPTNSKRIPDSLLS